MIEGTFNRNTMTSIGRTIIITKRIIMRMITMASQILATDLLTAKRSNVIASIT